MDACHTQRDDPQSYGGIGAKRGVHRRSYGRGYGPGQMWVGVLSSCFEIFPRQVRLRSPLVSHMSHRPAIQLRSGSEEARSNKSIPRGGAFGVDPMISGTLEAFSRSIHFLRPSHKLLQTVVTLLRSFPWFPCYSLISGMGLQ